MRRTRRRSSRSARPRRDPYEPEAAKLARNLRKKWVGVSYDPEAERGHAVAGSAGNVEFQESGNDPAVWVTIRIPAFKTSASEASKIIDAIQRVMARV
jgi:hypothetical protein